MVKSVFIALKEVAARDSTYEFLSSAGYTTVQCVPNTHQILKLLETERPYLLILGEDIPSKGGLKALERIRSFEHGAKVVLLTQDEPSAEIEAMALPLNISTIIKMDFSTHFMFKEILGILRQPEEIIASSKYMHMGKILVVDDAQEVREALVDSLKIKGFNVHGASNAEEALLEIRAEKPKVVLLDERMPGRDGLVVLKKIKEIDSSIKVVMLSAVQDKDVIAEAKRLGAQDYIVKPYDLEKTEVMILSILFWSNINLQKWSRER